jgi:hypothetical protein
VQDASMNSSISLTELRQRLFQLADHVAETGEPLVIVRNGVRLKLVRDDVSSERPGRLARLVKRSVVIGPALDPNESPAEWAEGSFKVAEPKVEYRVRKRPGSRRK